MQSDADKSDAEQSGADESDKEPGVSYSEADELKLEEVADIASVWYALNNLGGTESCNFRTEILKSENAVQFLRAKAATAFSAS